MATITSDITVLQSTDFGETAYINWEEFLSDSLQLIFNITDNQTIPQAIDFTGCYAEFLIFKDKNQDSHLLKVDTIGGGVVLNGVNNLVVNVTPAEIVSAGLVRDNYFYKVRVTYPDDYINTEIAGGLKLL